MDQIKPTCDLNINDTFSSYQELQEAVTSYGNARRVLYWRRDTKRLHRAPPKIFEVVKNYPQLEYCSIRFSCVHGGQTFRPKNVFAARRRKSRGTWKQDCKAEILVGLNEDKNRLIVKKIVDEHNHEIPSEEVFRQKTRRKMEKLKTAEPKIYEKIMKLEDKQNILNNLVKVNSLARSNNLKKVSNVLREKYRCSVTLQDDGSGKVIGFFFQDYHMRKCFDMFPEILFIDGTYLLQNIACCVYILCVENSLGGSDIVAVGVLTTKEKESVEWVVQKFKDNNPKCDKTVIVVTDKPTSEYDIVPRYFPTATKLICPYHALETFKKDTQPSKVLNVIPSESESALHFFSQLIESKSDEEYHTILEDMEDNVPYSLMDYFINNWHDLRNEWVKGFNPSIRTCINTKLDSSNLKLKSPVANCKTFSRFINNFFLVVYFRRNELQSELNRMVTKKHPEDVTEYSKHLTPYAVQKIKQFLSEMDEVSFDSPNDGSDVICESDGNTFVVSEISCNCDFFTIMKLPCVHLLAYRKSQGVDLFDEYLFSERWTKNYARDLFEEVGRRGDAEGVPTEGKFAKAHYACLSLAGLCNEVGEDVCSKRVEVLEKLRELWESGYEVKVQKLKKGEKEALFDHDYVRLESMESESF